MRLGQVIGRVTLSLGEESYRAGRFLLVQPLASNQIGAARPWTLAYGNSIVVYDRLGAGTGDLIGYVEGREAGFPFPQPTPVDAYNCALVDAVSYKPPKVHEEGH